MQNIRLLKYPHVKYAPFTQKKLGGVGKGMPGRAQGRWRLSHSGECGGEERRKGWYTRVPWGWRVRAAKGKKEKPDGGISECLLYSDPLFFILPL